MTYRPDFAAYHVGAYRDGSRVPAEPGDLIVHDDATTHIYRGLDPRWHAAWFDWASALFCDGDEPARLAGSVEHGFEVERGFTPPEPIPADDSDDYQAWLDGPHATALAAWERKDRPNA